MQKQCLNCGKNFTKKYKESKKQFSDKKFCSMKCSKSGKFNHFFGKSSWNKGKSSWRKGIPISDETKKKMSKSSIGKVASEVSRLKMSLAKIGKKQSKATRLKRSLSMLGKNSGESSHFWAGGVAKNPYPKKFNTSLKLKIRERDNFTCCLCGRTEREELEELNRVLAVNHIDFNKENCKESNLNTLCLRCNVKINRDRDYWTNYFNN